MLMLILTLLTLKHPFPYSLFSNHDYDRDHDHYPGHYPEHDVYWCVIGKVVVYRVTVSVKV